MKLSSISENHQCSVHLGSVFLFLVVFMQFIVWKKKYIQMRHKIMTLYKATKHLAISTAQSA